MKTKKKDSANLSTVSAVQQSWLSLPNLPYSFDCNASTYGIVCSLFHTHEDGGRKPVGFWSRSLDAAEQNYSASESECLAVLWALKNLLPYLLYEKFVFHTDHAALHWLLPIEDPFRPLMPWRFRLVEFDIVVENKKDRQMNRPTSFPDSAQTQKPLIMAMMMTSLRSSLKKLTMTSNIRYNFWKLTIILWMKCMKPKMFLIETITFSLPSSLRRWSPLKCTISFAPIFVIVSTGGCDGL